MVVIHRSFHRREVKGLGYNFLRVMGFHDDDDEMEDSCVSLHIIE